MIASTQITNTEISALIAVLVFKFLSRKVLFINRKGNRSYYLFCIRYTLLFQKIAHFTGKLLKNYK